MVAWLDFQQTFMQTSVYSCVVCLYFAYYMSGIQRDYKFSILRNTYFPEEELSFYFITLATAQEWVSNVLNNIVYNI